MRMENNSPESANTQVACYCVFCRTGRQKDVAASIHRQFGVTALIPVKVILEKRHHSWVEREVDLIPGYVFVYDNNKEAHDFASVLHGYRVLKYDTQCKALYGADEEFALWLFKHSGRLEISTMFGDGDSIKVISGPLTDCAGHIVKMDKHKQRALIEFGLMGTSKKIWLSFSWIEVENDNFDCRASLT